jgi:hypothetical protein
MVSEGVKVNPGVSVEKCVTPVPLEVGVCSSLAVETRPCENTCQQINASDKMNKNSNATFNCGSLLRLFGLAVS